MNLEQLKIIEAINETGSLTSAASKLHRSPSAISLNLKNLEQEWGIEIFDRSQYRLKLTREGEEILVRIQAILTQTRELQAYIKTLGDGPEASLRLCIDKIFPFVEIEGLLKVFQNQFPKTLLYISVKEKSEPLRLLEEKSVDLAIGLELFSDSETIETMPIYTLNLIPVAAPALILSAGITLQELEEKTQIIIGEFRKEDIGSSGVQKGESKWSVTDMSTKKSLIVQGLGYGYVPAHLIHEELSGGQLVEIQALPQKSFNFVLAKHTDMVNGLAKSFIWDSLRD